MPRSRDLTRRRLFQTLGASAAALPLVPVLESEADELGPPQRILFFWTPNGLERGEYTPDGGEFDFTFKRITAELERHRDRLLILDGLDLASFFNDNGGAAVGNDHYPAHVMCMTGVRPYDTHVADGPSIDHFIAGQLEVESLFDVLHLGVGATATGGIADIFWRGSQEKSPPRNDPSDVLTSVFGGLDPESPEAERLRAERRSVLDLVGDRLGVLKGRVGAADRHRIDAHLDAVRAVEKSLPVPNCAPPDLNAPYYDEESFVRDGQQQMDLMASALACDVTRVGTLQWGRAGSMQTFGWLGASQFHHSYAHHSANGLSDEEQVERLHLIGEWYGAQFAGLLDRLDDIEEPGGTVLDNTIVVWCGEQNLPPNRTAHARTNLPYVLVGDPAGFFRTGRYLDFSGTGGTDQYGLPFGVPHNRLYLSLCHAMGLTEVTEFGMPQHCVDGPLDALT